MFLCAPAPLSPSECFCSCGFFDICRGRLCARRHATRAWSEGPPTAVGSASRAAAAATTTAASAAAASPSAASPSNEPSRPLASSSSSSPSSSSSSSSSSSLPATAATGAAAVTAVLSGCTFRPARPQSNPAVPWADGRSETAASPFLFLLDGGTVELVFPVFESAGQAFVAQVSKAVVGVGVGSVVRKQCRLAFSPVD